MLQKIAASFLHLLYPPLCLHCPESLTFNERLLCSSCFSELSLIDPSSRCLYCFGERESANLAPCFVCQRHPQSLDRMAAACEQVGPAVTLLNQLKYGDCPYLAKGAGTLMAAQFLNLEWPFPDLIVPVPIPLMQGFERGYNQNNLLAMAIGSILSRPVENMLKCKREKTDGELIYDVKPGFVLQGQTILLVADMANTLNRCADPLIDGEPKALFGLAFTQL